MNSSSEDDHIEDHLGLGAFVLHRADRVNAHAGTLEMFLQQAAGGCNRIHVMRVGDRKQGIGLAHTVGETGQVCIVDEEHL